MWMTKHFTRQDLAYPTPPGPPTQKSWWGKDGYLCHKSREIRMLASSHSKLVAVLRLQGSFHEAPYVDGRWLCTPSA